MNSRAFRSRFVRPMVMGLAFGVLGAGAAGLSAGAAAQTAAGSQGAAQAPPAYPDPNPPILGRVDPRTYRVGPGDEIALRYSDLLDSRILRVGPAGDLVLPNVGPVAAAGLTLADLETRVAELMRPYVRGRGFSFSLYRPRRFRLLVAGEVASPGTVTLQAPVRASEAIAAAGGVAWSGSRRSIQVRRGADTLSVDLLRAARTGDLAADPLVFESDVIFVPPLGRAVEIQGAVTHPGRYDHVPGERLSGLVGLAGGGLPEAALEEATLERFDAAGAVERVAVRADLAVAAPGSAEDLALREGDRLFVPARARWRQGESVVVSGEVARPGPYPIRSGEDRLRDLLRRAGGLTTAADSGAIRIERAAEEAARDSTFLGLAERNPDLLSDRDRDLAAVAARERRAVSASVGRMLLGRDPRADIALYDGDQIVVPRRVPLVSVQGEVRAPGFVPYAPGRRAEDYVRDAGGYTSRADRGRVRVTLFATGGQVSPSEAGSLRPGDVVWVPAEREKSTWSQVREVLTTAAQVATIYLVVREATR